MSEKSNRPPAGRETNESLWVRVQRVIREAGAIKAQAESLVVDIMELSAADPERWHAAIGEDRYRLFCGDYARNKAEANEVFWSTVRNIILDQFGGFTVEEPPRPSEIFKLTVTSHGNKKKNLDETYWNFFHKRTLDSRRYCLASTYGAAKNFRTHEEDDDAKAYIDSCLSLIEGELAEMAEVYTADALKFSDSLADEKDTMLRLHKNEIVKLLFRLGILPRYNSGLVKEFDQKEHLFAQLEKSLTRDVERTPALRIGLLLKILGGRHLNSAPRCEPQWRASFRAGIQYVLERQNRTDGRWVDHERIIARMGNPLIHGFSPLVYILDLGADVLGPHLKDLTSSAERVLVELKRDLDEYASDLEPSKTYLVPNILIGLSFGAIAADRFKDLLSNSVLDSLGAIEPQADIKWKNVANALNFHENMTEGVIDEWTKRSLRRPGAILIYGPPGTGKTTIAKLIAKELNNKLEPKAPDDAWRFLELSPADFAREGSDRIVACAERLFSQIQQVRRCVVLLDEMEEFLRIRDAKSDKVSRLITTAFLPLLTEAVKSREIILIVATNFVGSVDPAVTRRGRFDLILPLGPPDPGSRAKILKRLISKQKRVGAERFDFIFKDLVEYTMGYTQPEIEDFFLEFQNSIPDRPSQDEDRPRAIVELWRIRSEQVPTALSGRVGTNWRAFADEALRFARYAKNQVPPKKEAWNDYWQEPALPGEEKRDAETPDRG